ncbi:MAG: alpha-ketoglutarate-dependent dioxygenase AlkB [Cyclobacteriaceae bacterium]
MDLFNQSDANLLPFGGEVYYHDNVVNSRESDNFYQKLMTEIEWQNDVAIMFGKRIVTKRKVAWYGDIPFDYTYSKVTRKALPWTKELLALKEKCSEVTGSDYNSCLLNLYHSGDEGMAWHSDDEKELAHHASIASLSFGSTRRFGFKHKKVDQKVYVVLEPGSLLEMTGSTQENWLHRLPPTKKVKTPRVNLTFRKMNLPSSTQV